MDEQPLLSVVVPVYRNEGSIESLVEALSKLADRIGGGLECVFVVDASPDASRARLDEVLTDPPFRAIVVEHTRNFGSFAAIRTGLGFASGRFMGVMAADLQEPPELMDAFVHVLRTTDAQVVVGERTSRPGDSGRDRAAANTFWRLYRRFVLPTMPEGGADVFACTAAVRDRLLQCNEANSSLVGLLFWLGFRVTTVPYERRARVDGGRSSWTFRKKFRYMTDSVYSFTDLPLKLLRVIGAMGLLAAIVVAVVVSVAKWQGDIEVPGYTALILVVTASTALIMTSLGIVGSYVWRAYENTKQRPLSVVERVKTIERH